jgi:beta-aspartyl-peptidase (threonine type)
MFAASAPMPARPNDRLEDRLHGILGVQQNAWNQGDIRQFMDAYWNDEALTFSSGGKTTRGWQATYERYKSKYPDRAAMGQLTFDALETSQIDEQAALTLGNWKLDKDKPARGNFSLVWKRIDGQWKIVHDHSSLLTEPN